MAPSDCGREGEPKQQADATFAGPERLVFAVTAPILSRPETVAAPSLAVSLANVSSSSASIASASLDPLRRSETGIAAAGDLSATIDAGEAAPGQVAPGQAARLTVSGRLPAKPGAYGSSLRVRSADGRSLVIPVVAKVGASPLWGIALLFLGLVTVGLLNLLDSESGVKAELRRVYAEREAQQDDFRHTEIPRDLAWQRLAIGQAYDAAVAALTVPRALSFVDHRPEDAKAHVDRAKALAAELRGRLPKDAEGGLAIAEVEGDLNRLADVGQVLSQLFMGPPTEGRSLNERAADVHRLIASKLLGPFANLRSGDLALQLQRSKLLRAAGRLDDASVQVENVDLWVKRVAEAMRQSAETQTFYANILAVTVTEERRLREKLKALPGETAANILAELDRLPAALAPERTWDAARDGVKLVRRVRTQLLNAEENNVQANALLVSSTIEKQDSMATIEDAFSRAATLKKGADGKIDAAERPAFLAGVLTAWQERLKNSVAPYPTSLDREFAAMSAGIASGNMDEFLKQSAALESDWKKFSRARAKAAVQKTTLGMCLLLREDLFVDLAMTDSEEKLVVPTAQPPNWEERLDQLRMKISRTPDNEATMGPNCLAEFLDLMRQADALGSEVLGRQWRDAPLSVAAKQEFAAALDPKDRPAFENNVKPLTIGVSTPKADQDVDHEIVFTIDGLATDWGPGVSVVVDFGDGGHETFGAEDLRRRRDRKVAHTYAAPRTFDVRVAALPYGKEMTGKDLNDKNLNDKNTNNLATPKAELLGEGRLQGLAIAASPSATARRIADLFFNARFLLALAVAVVLYFWRFYAKMPTFGAARFDYAEAFVIGFTVSLAINQLPDKLAGLVKGSF